MSLEEDKDDVESCETAMEIDSELYSYVSRKDSSSLLLSISSLSRREMLDAEASETSPS